VAHALQALATFQPFGCVLALAARRPAHAKQQSRSDPVGRGGVRGRNTLEG
jgi:hypothetical protein